MTSYVESILEELVDEERPEEVLDLEAFQEMMMAYLPQSELVKVDNTRISSGSGSRIRKFYILFPIWIPDPRKKFKFSTV